MPAQAKKRLEHTTPPPASPVIRKKGIPHPGCPQCVTKSAKLRELAEPHLQFANFAEATCVLQSKLCVTL